MTFTCRLNIENGGTELVKFGFITFLQQHDLQLECQRGVAKLQAGAPRRHVMLSTFSLMRAVVSKIVMAICWQPYS